jgi:hypothetical protein
MKIKYHIIASVITVALAVPFILFAARTWADPGMHDDDIGDFIFGKMGAPLGDLSLKYYAAHYGYLSVEDNRWAIPLWSSIFLFQWLIWANLIVYFAGAVKRRASTMKAQHAAPR